VDFRFVTLRNDISGAAITAEVVTRRFFDFRVQVTLTVQSHEEYLTIRDQDIGVVVEPLHTPSGVVFPLDSIYVE